MAEGLCFFSSGSDFSQGKYCGGNLVDSKLANEAKIAKKVGGYFAGGKLSPSQAAGARGACHFTGNV